MCVSKGYILFDIVLAILLLQVFALYICESFMFFFHLESIIHENMMLLTVAENSVMSQTLPTLNSDVIELKTTHFGHYITLTVGKRFLYWLVP